MNIVAQMSAVKPQLAVSANRGLQARVSLRVAARPSSRTTRLAVRAADDGGLKGKLSSFGKKLTGNEDYEFGDMTKNAAKLAKEAAEEVGKDLTGYEDYKLGDLTKGAIDTAVSDAQKVVDAAEAAGQILTGDEEYELGDASKKALDAAKGAIDDLQK